LSAGYSGTPLAKKLGIKPAARLFTVAAPGHYDELLAPTVPLSRHIFAAPTPYYKTGVVFLAYLNGHQEHFRMVGGLESGRSVRHLSELFVLADQAGLLREPDLAAARMRLVLDLAGVC